MKHVCPSQFMQVSDKKHVQRRKTLCETFVIHQRLTVWSPSEPPPPTPSNNITTTTIIIATTIIIILMMIINDDDGGNNNNDNNNNDNNNNNNIIINKSDNKNDNNNNSSSNKSDNNIIILVLVIVKMIMLINAFEAANRDFSQSLRCAANCLQHVLSSSLGAIVCISRKVHRALITCKMSCATWYEGTAQLLSLTKVIIAFILP